MVVPFDLARDTLPPLDGLPFAAPEWPTAPGVVEAAVFRALITARDAVPPTVQESHRTLRQNGPVTEVHPNGRRAAEWQYERGVRHGPAATWHLDGEPDCEGEWQDGHPHRAFYRWWPSGRRMVQGEFNAGRPQGEWCISDADGRAVYKGAWRPTLSCWLPKEYADEVAAARRR